MMYLAFYGNRYGGLKNNIIRWSTSPLAFKLNGKWRNTFSHVEIVFSDGMMFSASQYENKVRFKEHSFTGKAWVRHLLNISAEDEFKIREACAALVAKDTKYDYVGLVGFVIPFVEQDSSKEFCSEVCTRVLQDYLPELKELDSGKTSPNDIGFALDIL